MLSIRKNIDKHSNRLPGEVVESASSVFKSRLDRYLTVIV